MGEPFENTKARIAARMPAGPIARRSGGGGWAVTYLLPDNNFILAAGRSERLIRCGQAGKLTGGLIRSPGEC